jgi:hypothetical protein
MQTFVNSKLSFAAAPFASIEPRRDQIDAAKHQRTLAGQAQRPNRMFSQSRPAT